MESSTGGVVTALTNKRLLLGAALGADQGSGTAICIYAEHWIRDGVSASPRLTTYHC